MTAISTTDKTQILLGIVEMKPGIDFKAEILCCTVMAGGKIIFEFKLPLLAPSELHAVDLIGAAVKKLAQHLKKLQCLSYEIKNGVIREFGTAELVDYYLPIGYFVVFNHYLQDILHSA